MLLISFAPFAYLAVNATYEFLLSYSAAVREFCLVQESLSSICLQVVPGQGWSQEIEQKITSRFREFLEPNVAFRVDLVDECERPAQGNAIPSSAESGGNHRCLTCHNVP